MPPKSQQQRKLMHAVASGNAKGTGIPKKVAEKYVNTDKGGKLPKRVGGRKR